MRSGIVSSALPAARTHGYAAGPGCEMTVLTNVETSMPPPGGQRVPLRPEELTAEWLTASLRHAGVLSRANVTSFDLDRIGEGKGFAGQIARIRLRYDAPEPDAPASVIGKFATEHAPTREMLAAVDGYLREVRFYRELAPDVGIGTPRCYFAHYDASEVRFCLLLEDLAPAASADRDVGLSLAQAKLVLEQLAGMHAKWWNRTDQIPWLEISPDLMRRMTERFLVSLPRFIERNAVKYPELTRCARILGEVLGGDNQVPKLVLKPPLTLAHNDMHIDNILLPSADGGRFALIDWQSVGASRHGITDVARVLNLGMQSELRRAHEDELLRHYHAALCARGVKDYRFRTLKTRFRIELGAMVCLCVITFDALDFSVAGGEHFATTFATRLEQAVVDARIVSRVQPLLWLLRARRWLHRLFSSTPRIAPGT